MRIGVDATSWFNERGYGRYTRELLAAMVAGHPEHRFVCFVDAHDVERFTPAGDNLEVRGVALGARPTDAAASGSSRSVVDLLRMSRAVRREPLEVLFYPTVYTFFPVPRRLPAVVTVHDTITERHPELTLPSRRDRLFWSWKVKLALWQARLVLTVSSFSKGEIMQMLSVAPERIRVSGEAPAQSFQPVDDAAASAAGASIIGRFGLQGDERWITYVGGFNPHKNVGCLVRAHARAMETLGQPMYLLLVGTLSRDVFHGDVESIRDEVRRLGTEAYVVWTDFVPDAELRFLHAGALALVLPSEREGFGLPAAEAAACGTPMIATTQSPLPELFEGAGLFVEPRDEDGLTRALVELARDPELRRRMGQRALECARDLDWASAAKRCIAALEEAAA